jgi:hypothetical protein
MTGVEQAPPKWGDPISKISEERQAELRVLAEQQRNWATGPHRDLTPNTMWRVLVDRTKGAGASILKPPANRSPLSDHPLNGLEVYCLALYALAGAEGNLEDAAQELRGAFTRLEDLHLEGAVLGKANLQQADLRGAHLEGAYLAGADLQEAYLGEAHLEHASLAGAHLEGANAVQVQLDGADLRRAQLQHAHLDNAHLMNANLDHAHLEHARLRGTYLAGASLRYAHLQHAALQDAHLEHASLKEAHLEGVNLSRARLDAETVLELSDQRSFLVTCFSRAVLRQQRVGAVALADLHWNGVDLTCVDWTRLRKLRDEGNRWQWRTRDQAEKRVRANRQLANRLRDQGLSDAADRFAYRAQVCQRGVYLRHLRLLRWGLSCFLDVLAGYGYRPGRTLLAYLVVIVGFAWAYFQATHGVLTLGLHSSQMQPLEWYEALVLSVSSFHGRGFFQPVQSLGDPVAILAAAEAVFGLLIEVSFIATFTQRFFGK